MEKRKNSKACIVCRQRKVKCDALSRWPAPCSNCTQFKIAKCVIPQPKKKGSKKIKQILSSHPELLVTDQVPKMEINPSYVLNFSTYEELNSIILDPNVVIKQKLDIISDPEYYGNCLIPVTKDMLRKFLASQPDDEYPGPISMDEIDFNYLCQAGCFRLPNRELCQLYINTYFEKYHPQFPVINELEFRRDYKDLTNPPSLVLLQTVIYGGASSYTNSNWSKPEKKQHLAQCDILYRRAKILLEKNTEPDLLCEVQASIICGKHWSRNPKRVRTTEFSYIMDTLSKAYSLGCHIDQSKSKLCVLKQRVYKRIFWSLFLKDCNYASILGRPCAIESKNFNVDLKLSDMLDTLDTDINVPLPGLFFVYRVKLVKISKIVCDTSIKMEKLSEKGKSIMELAWKCDELLIKWIEELPEELFFKVGSPHNNIYNAAISLEFYNTLLLLHKAIIFKTKTSEDMKLVSWNVTFKASHMVAVLCKFFSTTNMMSSFRTSICEATFNAAIMSMYHIYNANKQLSDISKADLKITMDAQKNSGGPLPNMTFYLLERFYENDNQRKALIKSTLEKANQTSWVPHHTGPLNALGKRQLLPPIIPAEERTSYPHVDNFALKSLLEKGSVIDPTPILHSNKSEQQHRTQQSQAHYQSHSPSQSQSHQQQNQKLESQQKSISESLNLVDTGLLLGTLPVNPIYSPSAWSALGASLMKQGSHFKETNQLLGLQLPQKQPYSYSNENKNQQELEQHIETNTARPKSFSMSPAPHAAYTRAMETSNSIFNTPMVPIVGSKPQEAPAGPLKFTRTNELPHLPFESEQSFNSAIYSNRDALMKKIDEVGDELPIISRLDWNPELQDAEDWDYLEEFLYPM
ncbi:hypothetical protein DAMA08_010580 [Martiniozyma asiatica (nom. inval.)]|nr:hypothetical protein DAMA08_010580 [Martiniozyma asiatica]